LEASADHPAASSTPQQKLSKTKQQENQAPQISASKVSLATYLKDKNSSGNQVRRFLATAGWLSKRGNASLKSVDVAKALSENHQSKLSNPSDCLNQNVGKGHCEKKGDGFFVTPEGWEELGDST